MKVYGRRSLEVSGPFIFVFVVAIFLIAFTVIL
jgi:hypothetical protein